MTTKHFQLNSKVKAKVLSVTCCFSFVPKVNAKSANMAKLANSRGHFCVAKMAAKREIKYGGSDQNNNVLIFASR